MSRKICECDDLEILEKSNVLQTDHDGYPVRLCICRCKTCGRVDQHWLNESLEKAQEELKNGISVLLNWDYGKMDKGWICPKCGKANAPFVKTCDCASNISQKCSKGEHKYTIQRTEKIDERYQIHHCKCVNCGEEKLVHEYKVDEKIFIH